MSIKNGCLILPLLLATFTSCFFSRSLAEAPVPPDKLALIEPGTSTKEDVVRILGAPTDIVFSNRMHDPLHVFAYEYTFTVTKSTGFTLILVTFLNSDLKRDHVMVFFDDQGIVNAVGARFDAGEASYGLPFGD